MRHAKIRKVKLDSDRVYLGVVAADDLPEYIQEMLGLADAEFSEDVEVLVDTDREQRAETVYILETSIDITKHVDLDDLDEKILEVYGVEQATGRYYSE